MAEYYPQLSIIIPCHNEAETIDLCLLSLLNCDIPSGLIEIIIINDKSSDGTAEIVDKWVKRWTDVKLFVTAGDNGSIGAAGARNIGVQQAKGIYVAFLDCDIIVDKEWCNRALFNIKKIEKNSMIIGGRIQPYFDPKKPHSWALSRVVRHKPRYDNYGRIIDLPGGNLLMSKNNFVDLGGFNSNKYYGEDTDLIYRARQKNIQMEYDEKMIIYHRVPKNALVMARTQFFYGFSFQDHVRSTGDGSMFRGLFGVSVLTSIWWQLWILMLIPLTFTNISLTYFLLPIYLLGFFKLLLDIRETAQNNSLVRRLLFYTFFILKNWSYQVGFAFGLLKKKS